MRKVVTVQEKLQQLALQMVKGRVPALGHADLTALEAYPSIALS